MTRRLLRPRQGRAGGRSPGDRAARHRGRVRRPVMRTPAAVPIRARNLLRLPGSRLSAGVVLAGLVVAVVVAAMRAQVLPEKFSFDAEYIQGLAHATPRSGVDRSYVSTAQMYRLLGLQDAPVVVGVVTVALFSALVILALRTRRDGRLPIPVALLAAGSLVLGSVYLGTYSKDAPVLVVSAALILLGTSRWAEAGVLGVIAAYAIVFRSYWFLVLALFVGIRLLQRLWPRRPVWIIGAVAGIVVLGVVIQVGLHQPADYFRTMVNAGRAGDVDAVTMVRRFVDLPEPVGGVANVLVTYATLFLPVPLLLLGGGYYIGVFAVVSAVWGCFWWAALRTAPLRRESQSRLRATSFLVAFAAVQAFFEPDYGSALRHLSPLLPVLLMVVLGAVRPRASRVGLPVASQERGGRETPLGVPQPAASGGMCSGLPDALSA